MIEPYRNSECSFEFDVNGNVSNLTSDPNFLVYDSAIEFEVQKMELFILRSSRNNNRVII